MAIFEGTFETEKCFEMIPVTVVACNKDHGLLGNEEWKVDTTKLIKSMKVEENNVGLLRSYKVNICLKENHHPRYQFISYLW